MTIKVWQRDVEKEVLWGNQSTRKVFKKVRYSGATRVSIVDGSSQVDMGCVFGIVMFGIGMFVKNKAWLGACSSFFKTTTYNVWISGCPRDPKYEFFSDTLSWLPQFSSRLTPINVWISGCPKDPKAWVWLLLRRLSPSFEVIISRAGCPLHSDYLAIWIIYRKFKSPLSSPSQSSSWNVSLDSYSSPGGGNLLSRARFIIFRFWLWNVFSGVNSSPLLGGGNLLSKARLIIFRFWLTVYFYMLSYFRVIAIEIRTWNMNSVHKFQVDAIKTSKIRIFSDNPIRFKVWLSSSEMLVFLICTRLVIVFSFYLYQTLTFFSQIVISDDAAELPLAMK